MYRFTNVNAFENLPMVYHKCVKKVTGPDEWDSNNKGSEMVNVLFSSFFFRKSLRKTSAQI